MLKNNRFRSNIIDLLRKLPYDIFNHLLFSSMSDMNPDIDYNIFSDNCLLNYDNSIHFIEFQNLNLNKLPELFGAIRSSNNIYLHNNELNSLPDSFGFIEVGATLCLSGNNLTKLPESFQNINIKYDLFLDNNPNLDELPNSLPNSFQHIGGQIFIHETNISDDYISDKFSNISDKFENWFY